VGGRDINLAVGPMFDDVTINVLYNVVSTIVQETITSVEQFIALQPDAPEEVIDVVEDIFETNVPVETDVGMELEPIEVEEITYESIEIEIAEIEIQEIEVASISGTEPEAVEVNVVAVEQEIEMELELEVDAEVNTETTTEEPQETTQTEKTESSNDSVESNEEQNEEASTETNEESNEEKTEQDTKVVEKKSEQKQEPQSKEKEENEQSKTVSKKQSSKEKAAKKVLKKIDDKQKYDSTSQLKTLVVMQVLGNSKSFFESQQQLNDRVDFFTDTTLPDAVISDNDIAGYFLFVGSDGLMNEIIESQYK
jgi:DNA polymerase III gamma/tau subunit